MTSSSPPARRGRSAKSGSKKSFSEDSEEEDVEMISLDLEEDFPETHLFDPVSPPRKLSLKSKVTLKRIDMAKVDGSPAQVVTDHKKIQLISKFQSDNMICCLFKYLNTFLQNL